jgi:O-antigen/teichoic acid export membrane protein
MYGLIAIVVALMGLAIMPFLPFLIKDLSEVPIDINIYLIYALFLGQSVSSYVFIYKSSIFTADQKGYVISIASIITNIMSTGIRILILFLTKNFTLTLTCGIGIVLLNNFILSIYAQKKYPFVFAKKIKLDNETKGNIKKDVYAMLCHKVGESIVLSTDNILLSAFIGISALGIYSNYSLIILSVGGLLRQIFSTFISSIGNSKIKLNSDEYYNVYKRLLYLNLIFVSVATIALNTLINPFIEVWLGKDMLMNIAVVIALSISFFLSQMRNTNTSFVMASGLFRKDKLRPLIESIVNLVASIILVIKLGIIGIFIGTIISNFTVVFWREPYLIYKNEFNKKPFRYYIYVFMFIAITAILSLLMYYICGFFPNIWGYVILKFVLCGIVPPSILIALTFKTKEFKYFVNLLKSTLRKIFKRDKNSIIDNSK